MQRRGCVWCGASAPISSARCRLGKLLHFTAYINLFSLTPAHADAACTRHEEEEVTGGSRSRGGATRGSWRNQEKKYAGSNRKSQEAKHARGSERSLVEVRGGGGGRRRSRRRTVKPKDQPRDRIHRSAHGTNKERFKC